LYKKNAFQVGFTINDSDQYPAFFFKYLFIKHDEIAERTVYAIKEETKWVFYEADEPLEIEEPSNYLKKRIKDRINNEIILSYLSKAGYDLKDKKFYTSNKKAVIFGNTSNGC